MVVGVGIGGGGGGSSVPSRGQGSCQVPCSSRVVVGEEAGQGAGA